MLQSSEWRGKEFLKFVMIFLGSCRSLVGLRGLLASFPLGIRGHSTDSLVVSSPWSTHHLRVLHLYHRLHTSIPLHTFTSSRRLSLIVTRLILLVTRVRRLILLITRMRRLTLLVTRLRRLTLFITWVRRLTMFGTRLRGLILLITRFGMCFPIIKQYKY